eukprot:3911195-Pyramimonas_sp.AAC.1
MLRGGDHVLGRVRRQRVRAAGAESEALHGHEARQQRLQPRGLHAAGLLERLQVCTRVARGGDVVEDAQLEA